MKKPLLNNPAFLKTIDRFDAWWHGELIDRPPVTMGVAPSRPYQEPISTHATLREKWFDAEYSVRKGIASIEHRDFVGDSFPMYWPNIGPELTATLYGCELECSEHSSWSTPIVHEPEEWDRVLATPPNFNNAYWQWIEKATAIAIEQSQGRFVVGMTDLHGNYDILAALRDPQMLCMDVIDCPDVIDRVCEHVSNGCNEAFNRTYRQLSAAGFGSSCWTPLYYRGPAYVPNCDFWCMLSTELAEKLVLPRIVQEMQPLQRSIFHLDGPGALRHLDLLLKLPQLDAVQWVHGDGKGRASDWINVYRRIRAAGKSVQVMATDMADALQVVDEIGMEGVWLSISRRARSVAEAEEFLQILGSRT